MPQKKRTIRKIAAPTQPLTSRERKTVKHLLSMANALAFRSEIEIQYRLGHLTKGVLNRLFTKVNAATMHPNRKRAILKAITSYNTKV
jgi:hypothetical protein